MTKYFRFRMAVRTLKSVVLKRGKAAGEEDKGVAKYDTLNEKQMYTDVG